MTTQHDYPVGTGPYYLIGTVCFLFLSWSWRLASQRLSGMAHQRINTSSPPPKHKWISVRKPRQFKQSGSSGYVCRPIAQHLVVLRGCARIAFVHPYISAYKPLVIPSAPRQPLRSSRFLLTALPSSSNHCSVLRPCSLGEIL